MSPVKIWIEEGKGIALGCFLIGQVTELILVAIELL